ncbi:thiol-disulfide oxidoreductase DCC family protein [Edaphobacter aggregans]|uniref:thiol-disulfide oxidoreductase DCC family protein n=1 Tax=Edaphobacter aggregans TaxID=570835 RepID=UPI000689A052|nr:DCC1-like thiol-disulfide oxidoreductase family protein [Edaphobacter aggregans]
MTEAERARIAGQPVVLYDGVCALCNGVVRFCLKRDAVGMFRFAPLQSAVARELAGSNEGVDGVVLVMDALGPAQRVWRRSDAVAEALVLLGGGWTVLGQALRWVPRGLREWGYGLVARVRYRVFGRYAVCPVPSAAERQRFVGFEDAKS